MLNKRLRELRNEKKLTQKELADIFNMSDARYNQYETGKRTPDYETLNLFADFFDVSTDYLLGRTTIRKISKSNNDLIDDNIHLRLKELREELNLSQKELSDFINVSEQTINSFENGTITPDLYALKAFADFYKVSIDYLIGRSNIKKPTEEYLSKLQSKILNDFNKLTIEQQEYVLKTFEIMLLNRENSNNKGH